jgi:chromosome segregation ATPase
MSQQQVEKLQTQLSKSKGNMSKSDSSQAKLAELQRNLDQSKQKERCEAEKWTSKYNSLQQEKKQMEADWTKARTALASSDKEMQALQKRELDLLRQLSIEREARRQAEESLADARASLKEQANLSHRMQQQQSNLGRGLADLQDKVEDGQESLQEQSRQRIAMERVAMDYAMQLDQLQNEKRELSMDSSLDRVQIRRRRVRIESQDLELRQSRATIADLEVELQTERLQCQEALLQLDETLSLREVQVDAESLQPDHTEDFNTIEETTVLLGASEALRIASELALQEERERGVRLNKDIDELQRKYLDALQDAGTLQETQKTLEKIRQELESVEEAYEKGLLEAMRAHKGEEEVKRQLSQSKAENEVLTVKLRQMEKISQKLFHAKMKEEAWLQEREELLQELERTQHFEEEYERLRSQAQMLLSKSTQYEGRMEELTSLNTVLASHTNPSQKIYYLDRIRKELDEKRLECQALALERDQFKAVSKELQIKLDLFCKVESRLEDRPRTAFRRVARQSQAPHSMSTSGVLTERSPNKRSSPVKARKAMRSEEGEMRLDELLEGI